jgi:hypothetical protein
MAEASTSVPAGASQADNTAAINGATGQQNGSGEPVWLNHIPAEHREDAKKSYMLEADYRQKTMALSEKEKSWQEKEKLYADKEKNWDEFQRTYTPFRANLEKHWDKIAPILNGVQQQIAAAQQQQNPNQDAFENFDLLPPVEQAKRLAEHVQKQIAESYDKRFTDYRQETAKEIQLRENAFRNYLAVLTDAFEKKTGNPELDMKAYLQKALEYQNGNINPLEAAYSAVTSEATQKRQQEEWMKKGREEALLELQNKQQPTGAIRNSIIPSFGVKPMNRQQVAEAVRNEAVKAGRTW